MQRHFVETLEKRPNDDPQPFRVVGLRLPRRPRTLARPPTQSPKAKRTQPQAAPDVSAQTLKDTPNALPLDPCSR